MGRSVIQERLVQVEGGVCIRVNLQDTLFFFMGSISDGSKYLLPKYALLIPPVLTNFLSSK